MTGSASPLSDMVAAMRHAHAHIMANTKMLRPDMAVPGAFDYVLEPGMVLCVQALVGGDFSIKLKDQALITETGHENLRRYPFDAVLMRGWPGHAAAVPIGIPAQSNPGS